ncbi:sugar transporter SWEET1 isoform X2 [Alosa sapidissima]|uniref:sugar transporter SWEET1 isoform X2 n=1 Tax=Alosa sapidissima TaxID=34773 RepID=UPI001C098844|nr:sugar transporter SWEET1 isoform X2 [Alosa sapidissima]
MEFLQLLSCACIVFTVGMFSTGLTDLKKMRATQSADKIQFLPFLTTCLNNLGWLYYGLLKKDGTLIIVNTIGACLQTLYILAYCHYTKERRRALQQTLVMVCTLGLGWGYFSVIVSQGDVQLSQLGLVCSVFTISMYLSPLADLIRLRVREPASVPVVCAALHCQGLLLSIRLSSLPPLRLSSSCLCSVCCLSDCPPPPSLPPLPPSPVCVCVW